VQDFTEIFFSSLKLIFSFDSDLFEIVILSLKVSLTALTISGLIGLPFAAICSVTNFRIKNIILLLINSLMGLPPVFVGLVLYILFSNSGPLGFFQILYTPSIMIIAQIVLILPIIISLSFEVLNKIHMEYDEMLRSLNVTKTQKVITLLYDARYHLTTTILAGLGRAMSEVGAIIIVGGNIAHYTRVMTTTIALETSKGNLKIALSLGIILIILSFLLNFFIFLCNQVSKRHSYD
tara:strand:+ start:41 stop:748 length:708 start_codon:yes stop_codon:yes gene_type:complete